MVNWIAIKIAQMTGMDAEQVPAIECALADLLLLFAAAQIVYGFIR
jgi:hypothetical protein